MPTTLATTLTKIKALTNETNAALLIEFHQYLKECNASERHQNNCLKMVMAYAGFLGPNVTFYDVQRAEQILTFLDTKRKSFDDDPERKWITTWNYYLHHIKLFFRWMYNLKINGLEKTSSTASWETPGFARIKDKRSARLSPYTETDIWEQEELLLVVKYEAFARNKAALTLFWDLDARNHEVTMLKIKNVRLKEQYGEGEIPANTKTGGGPILLTCSFPYVRNWLNEHPFRNNPEARLICSLLNGAPVKPEAMWTMMKQLQKRIIRLLADGSIADSWEREKLEFLVKTKKWNPYCIRHSAITADSDFLPEYALKKKVRWSMNSKQGARYIKRRMGSELKRQILVRNGIMPEDGILSKRPTVLACPRCALVNALENKYCSSCSYPLSPQAYDELKTGEEARMKAMEDRHAEQMTSLREEMRNQFGQIMKMIQQNPKLAQVKPEVLANKVLSGS